MKINLTRFSFLLLLGIGSVYADKNVAAPRTKKPNFVIIFTDDQGYQDLGCFGSPKIKTSNTDRMAKEGMKFTSFYAQTVCGPSRSALMTGCYPLRNARNDNGEIPLAIREGKWKFHLNKYGKASLFNLEEDGLEQKEVSKNHPDITKRLQEKLINWQDAVVGTSN